MRDQLTGQVPDEQGESLPGGGARGRRLETVREIQREMGRVYAEARRNRMQLDRAKGLTYILGQMAALVKAGDLEDRLAAIEARLRGGAP
jgi:hypothetical protein